MIQSFRDADTEKVAKGVLPKRFPQDIFKRAIVKLDQLQAASELADLRIPPANRFEALQGDLAGFYSIRINNQWRICFRWENGNAFQVHITDYH